MLSKFGIPYWGSLSKKESHDYVGIFIGGPLGSKAPIWLFVWFGDISIWWSKPSPTASELPHRFTSNMFCDHLETGSTEAHFGVEASICRHGFSTVETARTSLKLRVSAPELHPKLSHPYEPKSPSSGGHGRGPLLCGPWPGRANPHRPQDACCVSAQVWC